jgi:hypothetical protein
MERKKTKGTLDLFLSLYDASTPLLLEVIKEFNPVIHFLAVKNNNGFDAPNKQVEVEDDLRSVCVKKYYPDSFFNYISCRAGNIGSSWWEDCAQGLDVNKIKTCAQGEEGATLLSDNFRINSELKIMFGPTYLLDNQEIFSSKGVPSKEDLKKIIGK